MQKTSLLDAQSSINVHVSSRKDIPEMHIALQGSCCTGIELRSCYL